MATKKKALKKNWKRVSTTRKARNTVRKTAHLGDVTRTDEVPTTAREPKKPRIRFKSALDYAEGIDNSFDPEVVSLP
ncbi:hypothetical protein KJ781_00185 [Patescibacteria group bacterium]|nr:hypothetical protein [Patescibacteria group bacterium]MBU1448770.1 hypothetical protein [Patescibacteria group bacterium]MBU2613402.1 hypothetical protein [Patescibacteria group bacterium]